MSQQASRGIVLASVAIAVIAIALSGVSLTFVLSNQTTSASAPRMQVFDVIMGEGEIIGEVAGGEEEIIGEFHRWEPAVLVVNQDDTVVLNVKNPRKHVHSLVLTAYGIDTGQLAGRGGAATVQFVADKTGVFQFACGIPHDHEAGLCDEDHKRMVGYLIVLAK